MNSNQSWRQQNPKYIEHSRKELVLIWYQIDPAKNSGRKKIRGVVVVGGGGRHFLPSWYKTSLDYIYNCVFSINVTLDWHIPAATSVYLYVSVMWLHVSFVSWYCRCFRDGKSRFGYTKETKARFRKAVFRSTNIKITNQFVFMFLLTRTREKVCTMFVYIWLYFK